jgi:hypothetical protein
MSGIYGVLDQAIAFGNKLQKDAFLIRVLSSDFVVFFLVR